ncbi:isopentenyl-diphosphate delta-isomerase [Fonticula alba]|uniref:isopentenyl-diphosphate Delta-isomerase n=1 Tax=Fonticula alba TaxID=691883 RepID=A0A058ZDU4_FONAL|nr:isopentenyl-diphosphate delta-isomerase [Fonticula alba]KCV72126.1 isopentenyl-diphosphate delta-isomerase [Fonticula alba]|eukprot:XP_009493704.1 isopentenyl-diphosphate delta-isomerase [Fonticula alba]
MSTPTVTSEIPVSTAPPPVDLSSYDPVQAEFMLETIVVVDNDDNPIGYDTKVNCHLVENIDKGLLHRAFSVFLFNEKNELLLQRRASEKITFPDLWTNTCCSHMAYTKEELDQSNNRVGAKRAAQRKLVQELGITPEALPLEDYRFLTRIHYMAPSGGQWAEHEIDYILIAKRAGVVANPNPNEISETKYVSMDELKAILDEDVKLREAGQPPVVTPWFRIICNEFLFGWWETMQNEGFEALAGMTNDIIHRM